MRDRGRQGGGVDATRAAQHIDARPHGEAAALRAPRAREAEGDRLHVVGVAQVGEPNAHGPHAVDRARNDPVRTRRREGILDRDRVGVHLQPPDAVAHLVEKVGPEALVGDDRRAAVARDPRQARQIGRRAARAPRMEEHIRRHELAEVFLVAHAEITEPRVARIRAVRRPARQPSHRLGGDHGAYRLARRVHEVEVVRLPAEVARRRAQHVVGEHDGELHAAGAKGPCHRRIHVSRQHVRRIELVDDSRHARELGAKHVGIGVDRPEVVPRKLMPGHEARRVPPERDAAHRRLPDRLGDLEILADVVEQELRAAGRANGGGQCVDVPDRTGDVLAVVRRLVDQLDEQDRRLVLERRRRIRVHMLEHLPQVVGLRGDGLGVGAEFAPRVVARESWKGAVRQRVRPAGVVGLDRAEQHVDTALSSPRDEVVHQVEVLVGDEVPLAVRVLPVAPEGQPHAIPSHARKVRHVLVDHPLSIEAQVAGGAVVRCRWQDVVRAEERDFLAGVLPADDAARVEHRRAEGGHDRAGLRANRRGSDEEQYRERQAAAAHSVPSSARVSAPRVSAPPLRARCATHAR